MTSPIRYERVATAVSGARAGLLHTRRGVIETPTFMPVATHAHLRNLTMDEVGESGARICLANTYHLLLRPGVEVFNRFGSIHEFMKWPGGVLTDSGGFQIFSLPGFRDISEDGAKFRSPYDNMACVLTPESSIATQQAIGSDIMMALDICIPSTSDEATTKQAMEQTHRWAVRSLAARNAKPTGQAIFGIVQGGVFEPLRKASAEFLTQQAFDGFAIGGLAVGESRDLLYSVTGFTAPKLPADKPRYLMGVGTPIDLVECVNAGIDMFDCIIPNKLAQQGYAYTFNGTVRISRVEFRLSDERLEEGCPCSTCARYTRGYLRHLAWGNHHLAGRLLTIHNLTFYQRLMKRMRDAIIADKWDSTYRDLQRALMPVKATPRVVPNTKHGAFELVTTRGGARAVKHTGHGEVMHPVGPWEEANRLYVEQTKLVERLKERDDEPLRILDVGLGAATNAVAAFTAAAALGGTRCRPMEIVSLEVDVAPLELALSDPEGFPFLQPWKHACEALLRDGAWEERSLSWRLIRGDAATAIDEADGLYDIIFYDPFSPESNPTLWTQEFMQMVRARARWEGSVVATYSAATPTRVSFLLAGFFVGRGVSTGTKGETTIAASRKELLTDPLDARWIERWERSSARAPHGGTFTDEVERAVRAHPQFQPGKP